VEVVIEMWPVTWTVKRGSRIRVDVSSSNFPACHAHPNIAGTGCFGSMMLRIGPGS